VRLDSARHAAAYKYAVCDPSTGRVVRFEAGENRRLAPAADGVRVEVRDYPFRDPLPPWRGAGVNVPLFSLRSRAGLGIGEFPDVKRLVDWARRAGLRMIQLLPVNDTIVGHLWTDSYPYAAISVCALHPIYMNLEAMQAVPEDELRRFTGEAREQLNALPEVDYESVLTLKSLFFKLAYDRTRDRFLRRPDFRAFLRDHREWLVPYAVFSCLRDRHGTCEHEHWPAEHRGMTREQIEDFAAPGQAHYDDVAVHYFIQFHLHRQLLDAARHARASGVVLKGDLPIGVFRHSVETWLRPELFHLDAQAGAPPDAFSAEGQNWEFPTYNWEAMEADGYAWWRMRLRHMARYFDALRIDHVLGFFRIWEIPLPQAQGILGHFRPALPLGEDELARWGVRESRERLCQPYLRDETLRACFGERAAEMAAEFFEPAGPGAYRPRPGLETQRAADERLTALRPPGEETRALRDGLRAALADVLFVEEPGAAGGGLHPRHSLHRTSSYAALPSETRARLDALYIDYFHRRHEGLWAGHALRRLPALCGASDMLICGEDLGMVPDCVEGVLRDLGILSLFVERMPKGHAAEFQDPGVCPYLSVCTPATHDMSPLREWWEEDRGRAQRYFNGVLWRPGPAPAACDPWLVRAIMERHLRAPSQWAVFLLQDLLGVSPLLRRADPRAERINEPGNRWHYWRYRMHIPLEELEAAGEYNAVLRDLLAAAGRLP
jgi:4-alpha-glucanotransferase